MSTKPVNLRLDEFQIMDLKRISETFGISFTDAVREALREYIPKKKADPLYRLTANVDYVGDEENDELAQMLDNLDEDDLQIVRTEERMIEV